MRADDGAAEADLDLKLGQFGAQPRGQRLRVVLRVAVQDRHAIGRAARRDLPIEPLDRLLPRAGALDIDDRAVDQLEQRAHAQHFAGEVAGAADSPAAQQVVDGLDEEQDASALGDALRFGDCGVRAAAGGGHQRGRLDRPAQPERDAAGVDRMHGRSALKQRRALAGGFERARELGADVQGDDCIGVGVIGVDIAERAGGGLGCGGQVRSVGQPPPKLLAGERDAVLKQLIAELDVQRHDADRVAGLQAGCGVGDDVNGHSFAPVLLSVLSDWPRDKVGGGNGARLLEREQPWVVGLVAPDEIDFEAGLRGDGLDQRLRILVGRLCAEEDGQQ